MVFDLLNREIQVGQIVVYPARPGGKGPLQLVKAVVTTVEPSLFEITVLPEFEKRPVRIQRVDRVAIVQLAQLVA